MDFDHKNCKPTIWLTQLIVVGTNLKDNVLRVGLFYAVYKNHRTSLCSNFQKPYELSKGLFYLQDQRLK